MVRQHQETPVEQPLLAGEDRLHHGLEVVIHHALGHAAEEGERAVVRVEHHLLGFARVGHHEHLAAERQAEMRDLDGLHDPAEFDVLVAPVELANLAGRERHRHKGLGQGRADLDGFPAPHIPLHAVVSAAVALGLQSLEQPTRGAPLSFGQLAFNLQPGFQGRLERTQHRRRLPVSAIQWFAHGAAMLAHRGTGQVQVTRDRADALLADQMTTTDLGNHIHGQHPRSPSAKAG